MRGTCLYFQNAHGSSPWWLIVSKAISQTPREPSSPDDREYAVVDQDTAGSEDAAESEDTAGNEGTAVGSADADSSDEAHHTTSSDSKGTDANLGIGACGAFEQSKCQLRHRGVAPLSSRRRTELSNIENCMNCMIQSMSALVRSQNCALSLRLGYFEQGRHIAWDQRHSGVSLRRVSRRTTHTSRLVMR